MKYDIEIVNKYPELNEFISVLEIGGGTITEIFYDPTSGYTGQGYLSVDVRSYPQNYRISGSGIQSEGNFMFLHYQRDLLNEAMEFTSIHMVREYPGPYPIPA